VGVRTPAASAHELPSVAVKVKVIEVWPSIAPVPKFIVPKLSSSPGVVTTPPAILTVAVKSPLTLIQTGVTMVPPLLGASNSTVAEVEFGPGVVTTTSTASACEMVPPPSTVVR
jgi:hypothetical protein